MLVLGIILVIAIGFLAVNCISVKFMWSEKIGLAFPVGIGLQTMMMLIINLLKIKLITASVMLGGVLILLLLLSFLYKRRDGVIMYYKKAVRIDTSNCNLVLVLLYRAYCVLRVYELYQVHVFPYVRQG